MTLTDKLQVVSGWNRTMALECWTRYHELYVSKYQNALFYSITSGTYDKYIARELETFKRYAQMYLYHKTLKTTYS